LTFSGANTYEAGTTVSAGRLIAANNSAFGRGTLTVSGGSLIVNSGITLTNGFATVANGGTLGGVGTFSPAGGVTIGSSGAAATVAPGTAPSTSRHTVGTLTFTTGLTLASGGTWLWNLQSPGGTAGSGWDLLSIAGNLNLTATDENPFKLKLISVAVDGDFGFGSQTDGFNPATTYQWTIATASGAITGFSDDVFVFDTSLFANSLAGGNFSISQSGNNLMLNFTPVPEPSTYALMGLGLTAVFLRLRRRRA